MTTHDPTSTRIGISDAARRIGKSPSFIRRELRAGRFPAGVFIGEHRKWTIAEIEQWIAEQASRPRRGAANLAGGEAKP